MARPVIDLKPKNIQKFSIETFNGIRACVEKLRIDGSYTTKAIKDSKLQDVIFDHTGILTDSMVKKRVGKNAFVKFPNLDKNHPFFATYQYTGGSSETTITALALLDSKLEGTVDMDKMKIGGVFSKVRHDMTVGYELMIANNFTSEEITAIILHELGHIFTYYRFFGMLTKRNFLLGDAMFSINSRSTKEQKVVRLEEISRSLGIDQVNYDTLLTNDKQKSAEAVTTAMVTNDIIRSSSVGGNSYYDVRTVEQIADQFATKHGAGMHLSTALNKIYQEAYVRSVRGPAMFVAIELVKLMFYLFIVSSGPITAVLYTLSLIPGPAIYDSPLARIQLIKRQMVNTIREQNQNAEYIKELRSQIEVIEKLEAELEDRRSLFELAYQTLTPRGRSMYKQEVFSKNLESLIYNETYLASVKFGALNGS